MRQGFEAQEREDDLNEVGGDDRDDVRRGSAVAQDERRGLWLVGAAACVVASAVLWWSGFADAAFVAAALGVVAYFMNQRAKYRRIRDEHENAQKQKTDESIDADEREP